MAATATATPPRPALPGAAARTPAAGRPADRSGLLRRITARGTPAVILAMLAVLVAASLAWGGFGAWAVAVHSSAANSLAHVDEPSSLDAQKLYLYIADADVTSTASFLQQSQPLSSGTTPPSTLADRQRVDADIAGAAEDLAAIQGRGDNPQLASAVATITHGLASYQQDVAIAVSQYQQGITPTGNSEMEVASEEAHLELLPAASQIYQIESAAVTASSGEATSLPTLLIALVVALAALIALVRAQRWVARRTRRVFNLGLLVATAALVISGGWLLASVAVARADLSTAINQGATPAGRLAQASIDVQRIRGDSILNVIARSGGTTLPADSARLVTQVGPGTGSLLAQASGAGNGQVTSALRAAMAAAPAWYAVNAQGYKYGGLLQYSAEQATVLNTAKPGFTTVKGSIDGAIGAAEETFKSQASAGAGAFGPLEAIVIVASLLMAAASAYGLYRRLAEYR